MLSLKDHPFAVAAFFKSSVVLTFAVSKQQLEHLLPECLELDLLNGEYAFIAIAMVETEGLRPKGFPRFLGNDFFLAGYRIFVRYTTPQGKRLRGLYILKSETDKKRMQYLGNLFTHYNYTTTDIIKTVDNAGTTIKSLKSGFYFTMADIDNVALPKNSPFKDWKEARRFAGPLPFTFTYKEQEKEVLIIQGVRQNWIPKPLHISHHNFSFLESLNLQGAVLANAFIINDVPYYWKKGRKEKWER